MTNSWDTWDKVAEDVETGGYFKIVEGANKFVLLTHLAPLAQVYENGKYRAAVEGDVNQSIKGVGWVLQKVEDKYEIKEAKLPYTIVKAIKGIAQDPEWEFELPFLNPLTLNAVGAGTKEVKYTLTPSPKKFEMPEGILEDLATRKTPEEMVEGLKGVTVAPDATPAKAPDVGPDINPEDIPF
jgi:hypothetical protein